VVHQRWSMAQFVVKARVGRGRHPDDDTGRVEYVSNFPTAKKAAQAAWAFIEGSSAGGGEMWDWSWLHPQYGEQMASNVMSSEDGEPEDDFVKFMARNVKKGQARLYEHDGQFLEITESQPPPQPVAKPAPKPNKKVVAATAAAAARTSSGATKRPSSARKGGADADGGGAGAGGAGPSFSGYGRRTAAKATTAAIAAIGVKRVRAKGRTAGASGGSAASRARGKPAAAGAEQGKRKHARVARAGQT